MKNEEYININEVAKAKGLSSNRSLRIAIQKGKYIAREVTVQGGKSYEIKYSSLEVEVQEKLEDEEIKSKSIALVPMENITIEDMPNDDLKFVAQCAGIKAALTLIFCLPGLILNIPKNALKRLKERYILKEYDGTKMTLNRLVVECDLSQRQVEALIRKQLKKSKKPPADSINK